MKWFIEGDISDCFGSIDHKILIRIMEKKIDDNRFLRLIKNLLKSGYIDDWKYNSTVSGCPQGGILSPLLSNIYMDILDQFVEQHLMPKYTFGTKRSENKEYVQLKNQIRKFQRQKNWAKIKEIRNRIQKVPSKDPNDPNFKRLYYIRYADDWLVGVSGNKGDSETIKEEIKQFLILTLKLNLSTEKTLITHARKTKKQDSWGMIYTYCTKTLKEINVDNASLMVSSG